MKKPIVDIVIKTYSGDHAWLVYSLRSIQKFAKGFRRVIVISPAGDAAPPTGTLERVFYVSEQGDGYMVQQSIKLHADAFTDADFLLYQDSDTIFTRPITPQDFIKDGRVSWLYTPRKTMGEYSEVWKGETEKAVLFAVEHEFMRRHPFCVPRWALEKLRAWFWINHQMSLERYIAEQPGRHFSEWNTLGAWLWNNHKAEVNWINTESDSTPPFVVQHYSWGGLTPEIAKKMDAILA